MFQNSALTTSNLFLIAGFKRARRYSVFQIYFKQFSIRLNTERLEIRLMSI